MGNKAVSEPEVRADYHQLVRSDVFALMPARMGRVLDLGGGTGATSAALKEAGQADEVVLVDLVADNPHPLVDKAYSGDLEDPELLAGILQEAGPFDTVLCLDVLEHLVDPWSVIERLHAGLSDGGSIVISLPNVRNYQLVLPLVLRGRFELTDAGIMDRTHMRWFTKHSAIRLATSSGLHLEEVQGKLKAGRKIRLINAVSFGLLKGFLDLQYLIRVKNLGR